MKPLAPKVYACLRVVAGFVSLPHGLLKGSSRA